MALSNSKYNDINELKRERFRREDFKKTNEFKREFKIRKIENDLKFWSKFNNLTSKG